MYALNNDSGFLIYFTCTWERALLDCLVHVADVFRHGVPFMYSDPHWCSYYIVMESYECNLWGWLVLSFVIFSFLAFGYAFERQRLWDRPYSTLMFECNRGWEGEYDLGNQREKSICLLDYAPLWSHKGYVSLLSMLYVWEIICYPTRLSNALPSSLMIVSTSIFLKV